MPAFQSRPYTYTIATKIKLLVFAVEIKCSNPPEVNNTAVDVGGTRMNEYAYYECVDGFRLEGGSMTKRCNKDEEWEGEDPVCVGG